MRERGIVRIVLQYRVEASWDVLIVLFWIIVKQQHEGRTAMRTCCALFFFRGLFLGACVWYNFALVPHYQKKKCPVPAKLVLLQDGIPTCGDPRAFSVELASAVIARSVLRREEGVGGWRLPKASSLKVYSINDLISPEELYATPHGTQLEHQQHQRHQ